MPDFTLVPKLNGTVFHTVPWTDPPAPHAAVTAAGGQSAWDALNASQQFALNMQHPDRPSRVTAIQGRQRFAWQATVNRPFQVWCQPDGGVAGCPDSALGGRLFDAWFAESPELPLGPNYSVGYTSRLYYTPHLAGHYVLVVRRNDGRGGGVVLHIDVVDPTASAPP
ncbi:MAG TPA: hypothetical protein VFQ35_19925 [Polyangiaceae bacterium]|jgi:hypothetical protein|nr:hypothetical protein [Polyangiaceae bacterium]